MNKLALSGARLIDGRGGEVLEDSLILIEGKIITYAGVPKEPRAGTTIM